jgi:hypothetical protein
MMEINGIKYVTGSSHIAWYHMAWFSECIAVDAEKNHYLIPENRYNELINDKSGAGVVGVIGIVGKTVL